MEFDRRLAVNLEELMAQETRLRPLASAMNYKPEGLVSGRHRSKLRGNGLDFEELRPYQRGDSVRAIDWKASQRGGKTVVRVFSEETDRPVIVALDLRPAMFFGSQIYTKSMVATHLAAALSWLALMQGDRVGASVVNDGHLYFPAKRGRDSLVQIFTVYAEASQRLAERGVLSSIADDEWIEELVSRQPPQSSLYLITDGNSLTPTALEQLESLAYRVNLAVLLVEDRFDINLQAAKGLVISDGASQLQLDHELVSMPGYQQRYDAMRNKLKTICLVNNLPFAEFLTEHDPLDRLIDLFWG